MKGPQKRELPCPAPRNLPSEGTSESGLSDESSSPEGDALWVGFERNQLNQPNPELWKRRGVLWSVGWRLTPPHRDGGETGEEGTPQEPSSPALHHHLEEKTPQLPSSAPPSGRKGPSTFVFSFTFLSFSLWTVFWEDFLSAFSEDSSSSSLTDMVELSEILRALGISDTWN